MSAFKVHALAVIGKEVSAGAGARASARAQGRVSALSCAALTVAAAGPARRTNRFSSTCKATIAARAKRTARCAFTTTLTWPWISSKKSVREGRRETRAHAHAHADALAVLHDAVAAQRKAAQLAPAPAPPAATTTASPAQLPPPPPPPVLATSRDAYLGFLYALEDIRVYVRLRPNALPAATC
jgi:hypothetical protein